MKKDKDSEEEREVRKGIMSAVGDGETGNSVVAVPRDDVFWPGVQPSFIYWADPSDTNSQNSSA